MKRVAEIRLSEDDDLEAVFPPEYERIVICADTVRIEGHVHLPGRRIDIYARSIDPHPVQDRPAMLDVSGCPGVPDFDPEAPSPELNGSPTAPDGRPGQAGGDGQNAGQVSIVMDCAEAAFEIAANGAKGGNSQRGGDGTQPVKVDGVDGVFLKAKWPAKGKYGGGVLQNAGLQRYVSWAAGQKGGDARQGGAAGVPGQPGAGGQGGAICIRFTGSDRPILKMSATGGDAGLPGPAARPGEASAPGTGGRNLMYAYDITKTRTAFARSGADSVIDSFASQYKIPARAANGSKGTGPGMVPSQPTAKSGQPGKPKIEQVAYNDVSSEFDSNFLQLVLVRADRDSTAGNRERALQRYCWLVHLTGSRAKDDEAVAQLRDAAQNSIDSMKSDCRS